MKPQGTAWQSTRFYKKLRKLNDQKKVSKRELLGLYFDMYELLMAISEEGRSYDNLIDTMMSGAVGPKMVQLSPEAFEEVVKRDKKATAEKTKRPEGYGEGQYL